MLSSPASPPAPLLTVADVAELLRVSPRQVYRLVREADLPTVQLIAGGDLRFRSGDVARWLDMRVSA